MNQKKSEFCFRELTQTEMESFHSLEFLIKSTAILSRGQLSPQDTIDLDLLQKSDPSIQSSQELEKVFVNPSMLN